MRILHMNASYGRLRQAELDPGPGLNLICAPNEAGKSTWCSFIRTMLYGLPTRASGPMADKNRYAPWDGGAMQGSMELETDGEGWTVLRETRRANAPMQSFQCTYTGTAQPVPGVNGQNLGERLLGVPREVFHRSAFIGQSALRVDQDPELERRIAALLSSGQEEVSYSESYERLKKQLNALQYHKSGSIPRLEEEQARLENQLAELESLSAQEQEARQQLRQAQERLDQLRQQQKQWELLEQREALRQRQQAQEQMQEARQQLQALEQLCGTLPTQEELAQLQGQLDSWRQAQPLRQRTRDRATEQQQAAQSAQAALEAHPLYPAEQGQLRQRLAAMQPPVRPGWGVLIAAAALLCAGIVCTVLLQEPLRPAAAIAAVCGAVGLGLYDLLRRRRVGRQTEDVALQRQELERQMDAYATLLETAQDSREEARTAEARLHALEQQQETQLWELLARLRRSRPEVSGPEGAALALAEARRQRSALTEAARNLELARTRYQALAQQTLTPLPESEEELPCPALSREQLRSALPAAEGQVQAARSRLDSISGRLRAMDSRESLQALLQRCREELERQQRQRDAVRLAMEALESANQTLQNRFAPALGAETAEIFSALTGGRYDTVLLDRELRLSARRSGEAAARNLELLSRGAADQLYLAARLAICRLVLPAERSAPLILDDAFAYFDDERLAAALDWLLQESRNRQILLFTCQDRERQLLAGREDVRLLTLA